MSLPCRFVHQNILVGHRGGAAAVYRVDTVSYPFLPTVDKKAWMRRLAHFAYAVGADFSLYRVCRSYPFEQYVAQARGMVDKRYQDPQVWEDYLAGHIPALGGLASFIPEVYLVVGLEPVVGQTFRRSLGIALRQLESALGVGRPQPVPTSELELLIGADERALRQAERALPVRRATVREIQWLHRRAQCRGLGEPRLDNYWQPAAVVVSGEDGQLYYEPMETDLVRHANAPVYEENRHLVVQSPEGLSYQAMLALGALPEDMDFPGGAELLYEPLESLGFPVDAVVHARVIPNHDAVSRVRRKIQAADVEYEAQMNTDHGPLSYRAEEDREAARDHEAYLADQDHPPLLRASVLFAVGAGDPAALTTRVEALESTYGTIALHKPLGLQQALYNDHLPRPDAGHVLDYADVLTVEQFGALMAIGTHMVGGARGAYFAHTTTGSTRPVKVQPVEAAKRGRAPSILLSGKLGSGKTFAAQLLALICALRGSLVIDTDPKDDHHLEDLPELAGLVEVIYLSGDERSRGRLDPLIVAPEMLREDLANAYYLDLLGDPPREWQAPIRRAVAQVVKEARPCGLRVIEILGSGDRFAQAAAAELEVWADSGVARLGFGTGIGSEPEAHRRVVTMKADNLVLPEAGVARVSYDPLERLGVATLKLMTAFASGLIVGDNSVHKFAIFDEAWYMLGTAEGRRLLDKINHLGRTWNATLALLVQQLHAVGDIEGLIGTRMFFAAETPAEAQHALQLLGLNPNNRALVDRMRGYRDFPGRCLMRDIDDKLGEIQVDAVYEHLVDAWETNPPDMEDEEVALP